MAKNGDFILCVSRAGLPKKSVKMAAVGTFILCRSYTSGVRISARVTPIGDVHFVQSLHKPSLNFRQNVRRKHE